MEYIAAPFVGRVPARRFVIVCGPRTGSELLRTLLDSLEGVRCQGELLVEPKRWPVAYLNGRAAIGGLDQRAWGCKVIDSHLSPVQGVRPTSRPSGDRVLAELAGQGWVIVHLRRRDRLAQALSGLHAMQAQWHFRQDDRFEPFEADTATVIALLHSLDCNARWLEESLVGVSHTDVSYEDDLRTPDRQEATIARLADLLQVATTGTSTDLRAVAPERPEDRLTNFPELRLALEQTRFAPLVQSRSREAVGQRRRSVALSERERGAASTAKGFLPDDEAEALHAAALEADGPFLEVGSYCGRSTVWLGAAARARGTVLFAVDHHRGSEENQPGLEWHDPDVVDPATGRMDTLPFLRRTLAAAGLDDVAIPVVGPSATVGHAWATPLGFLFIDGGHGDEVVRADEAAWLPHVRAGGLLAIHDVFADPAAGGRPPYELYRRCLASGLWLEASATGSLRVLRRDGA